MKKCSKCKETKPKDDFHRDKRSKDRVTSECRKCHNKVSQAWRDNLTPEEKEEQKIKTRWGWLLRAYGLGKDDYRLLLEMQKGLCAICAVDLKNVKIDVDHCHDTGEVRGLLCHKCNMGVGLLSDDILTVANALLYLQVGGTYPILKEQNGL